MDQCWRLVLLFFVHFFPSTVRPFNVKTYRQHFASFCGAFVILLLEVFFLFFSSFVTLSTQNRYHQFGYSFYAINAICSTSSICMPFHDSVCTYYKQDEDEDGEKNRLFVRSLLFLSQFGLNFSQNVGKFGRYVIQSKSLIKVYELKVLNSVQCERCTRDRDRLMEEYCALSIPTQK